jgi:hypothetical protein
MTPVPPQRIKSPSCLGLECPAVAMHLGASISHPYLLMLPRSDLAGYSESDMRDVGELSHGGCRRKLRSLCLLLYHESVGITFVKRFRAVSVRR